MFHHQSLGNLSRFPPEIRLQIWEEFSLHSIQHETDLVPAESKQPSLAFLQTSHWIHDEASTNLYKDVILRFQVSPEYKYQSWLTIESNAGRKWHLRDLDDALSRGFGKLPYEKLKGIHLEIQAPCRKDPGQIVCLWKKCLDLATLLECSDRGLPNLKIHLRDSPRAKWFVDNEPQSSVAVDRKKRSPPRDKVIDRSNEQSHIMDEDYKIALKPFCRLRNVKSAKVYLPEDMGLNNQFAYHMETVLARKELFGSWLDFDNPWNDKSLQDDQDQMFMDLDVELDMLPGITANMMRLERFSSWYSNGSDSESKYETELERILKTRSTVQPNHNKAINIQWRYANMIAFSPRCIFLRYKASKRWDANPCLFASTEKLNTIQDGLELGLINREEWDSDAWHYGLYPEGIPPFDSEQHLIHLWTELPLGMSMECDEFDAKVMMWECDNDR